MNRRGASALALLGFLLCGAAGPGSAGGIGGPRATPALDSRIFAGKRAGETASFLVVMEEQADLSGAELLADKTEKGKYVFETLRNHAEVSQASLRDRLRRLEVAFRPFYLVNMLEVDADRSVAEELVARPDVAKIAANLPVAMPEEPIDRQSNGASPYASRLTPDAIEPNIAKIGAPVVWSLGFRGQGIVIASADTGFAWDHAALRNHYRGFDGASVSHDYNWHDAIHNAGMGNPCGSNAATPCDDDGHGTYTTGIAVGDDSAGNQIGVAPGARFMGCRNMDRGVGTPARYTECFQFFLAPTDRNEGNPRPDLAPHVINNSWGCPPSEGCTDPNILRAVVENVRAAGIFVVVSAGNEGSNGCSSLATVPAFYEASFSVGATTLSDTIAGFSSRGPVTADGSNRLKPDLSAPGVAVRSANIPNTYATGSGTSAAGPHVAGAVALLWSALPQLIGQTAATADLLRTSAMPLRSTLNCGSFSGAAVPNPIFGWGRLDIANAVLRAVPVSRPAALPASPRGIPRSLSPRP